MGSLNLLKFQLSTSSASSIVSDVMQEEGRVPRSIACFNPHSYAESKKNPEFSHALKACDVLVPDGAGVELVAKLLGFRQLDRVTGSDLFDEFMRWGVANNGLKVFLLGSTEDVLRLMINNIENNYPEVTVCGVFSPPFSSEFSDLESSRMLEAIKFANPDILFIGMTAPKQELWMMENLPRLHCRSVVCIGAVFDFVAGTKPRPGLIMRRLRLEWLGRLLREPFRMWRRTLISAPIFVKDLILWRLFDGEDKMDR